MRVWCLLLGVILLAPRSWGENPNVAPDARTLKEKKEWVANVQALKAAGAQLHVNGNLRIYGYDLQPVETTDFSGFLDDEEKKKAEKDLEGNAESWVTLTTSPNGRWTVIHLTNNTANDFWIYDHHSKAGPQYFKVNFGRFDTVYWLGNHLFRVLEGCSMICCENEFFKPEDVQHPAPETGDFFDYLPERDLYISDYDDGLEVGHPFGLQKPKRFFVKKDFLRNYENDSPDDPENVEMLPDNSDRDFKVVLKGWKLFLDYKTEGGKKVHKEFVVGKF